MNLDGPLTLCRRVEELCLDRILEIERRSDPSDSALRVLLREIESGDRAQLETVPPVHAASSLGLPELSFPSSRESLGEAPLTRENAIYHVESLKAEASRFFQRMAGAVEDPTARQLFTRLALAGLGQVIRLRTVIL